MRPNSIKSLDSSLFLEDVSLLEIAKKYPTPFYIYSKEMILAAIDSYLINIRERDLVCYSVKANSNPHLLKLMIDTLPDMGTDCSSPGEVFISNKVGIPGWNKSTQFLKNTPNVIIEKGVDGKGDLYNFANLNNF